MSSDPSPDRRTVLQGIGASAVGGSAFAREVSAEQSAEKVHGVQISDARRSDLLADYESLSTSKQAFAALTAPLRAKLAREGYLDSAGVSVLGLERQVQSSPLPRDADLDALYVGAGALEAHRDGFVQMDTKVVQEGHEIVFTANVTAGIAKAWVVDGDETAITVKTEPGVEGAVTVQSDEWGCSTDENGTNKCWTCNCIWSCGGYYELYCTDGSVYQDCAVANTDQKCCYDCSDNSRSSNCCCSWC